MGTTRPNDYLFPWVGGKNHLRKYILPLIPQNMQDQVYIEPFFGGGSIFFGRERMAGSEIINDLNNDIINLYKIVQKDPEAFTHRFDYVFRSRTLFNEIRDSKPTDNFERAFRTFYLLSAGFGGKYSDAHKPTCATEGARSITNWQNRIRAISKRLQNAFIENKDALVLIEEWNRKRAFFYLDPPYFSKEKYYNDGTFNHTKLAELLKQSAARWILSYNDCPEIIDFYKDFKQKIITRRCALDQHHSKDFSEIIIWNFNETIQETLF